MNSPGKISVIYLLNDKLGGVTSMNGNLIKHRNPDMFQEHVLFLRNTTDLATRFNSDIGADSQAIFEYSSYENLYAVLRRLHERIPPGPGVLIANDYLELEMLRVHSVARTVMLIVHDEFNLELAVRHEPVIDVFIAHSQFYFQKLKAALPHRREQIFYRPYGIPLPPRRRQPAEGPLRLTFVGRMVEAKGIFDLPVIDRLLTDAQLAVRWTVIGNGPQRDTLQQQWGKPAHVRFLAPATNAEVLDLCVASDVFVFPTRFEGFPVALLEAMSVGLVPVVSDIPSGVPEVVARETGFRLPIGSCQAFAAAICELARDRPRLEAMSQACRQVVEGRFDIRERVKDYEELFAGYRKFRRPRPRGVGPSQASRLDQPWLPNWLVQAVRRRRSLVAMSGIKGKR